MCKQMVGIETRSACSGIGVDEQATQCVQASRGMIRVFSHSYYIETDPGGAGELTAVNIIKKEKYLLGKLHRQFLEEKLQRSIVKGGSKVYNI